jgi:Raf kinase inhibitor-like YbhB/YbcL family protein
VRGCPEVSGLGRFLQSTLVIARAKSRYSAAPDPKAPKMVWVHWVVYNIPPETGALPENAGKAELPQGTLLGLNDFKKTGYGGPCPPIGRHRYFHKLYALDIMLDLKGATKSQMERAMRGHVLANAELIGTYQKGDR